MRLGIAVRVVLVMRQMCVPMYMGRISPVLVPIMLILMPAELRQTNNRAEEGHHANKDRGSARPHNSNYIGILQFVHY